MGTTNMHTGDAIMTPEFRVSFPSVFEPNEYEGKQSFGLTMLFPKGDPGLKALYQAAEKAARDRWGNDVPKNLLGPFKNGDQEKWDGYEGMIAVKAMNYVYNNEPHRAKPGVVDANVRPILSTEEFYAGCYARAKIIPKATGGPGTKYQARVSFGIRNIQKLRDGEAFGGTRVSAEDDFDPVADDADNPSNYPDAPKVVGGLFGQEQSGATAPTGMESLFG